MAKRRLHAKSEDFEMRVKIVKLCNVVISSGEELVFLIVNFLNRYIRQLFSMQNTECANKNEVRHVIN